ncbi:Serine protease, subtilase family, partial [Candidatus Methanophagaceae archaeon]
GTWWLFFDVTDKITPEAINKAEARVTSASMDGRVMRMVLIEAYEGGDDPQDLMYWVNDGHMNLHYNSSGYPTCIDYTKAWFNGTVPSGVTEANLTGVWLTGSYREPDYFYFNPPDAPDAPNGNNLNWDIGSYSDYQFGAYDIGTGLMSYADVAMGGGWYPSYFDIHSNTTTNTSTLADVLKTDNNYAISWRGHDDNGDGWIYGAFGDTTGAEGEGYVHPVIAVLVLSLETGPGTEPDLTVEGINAFHYDSDQKAWFNLTNEVNVTVNNTGDADAGAFNVSLYANDEFIAKQSVSGIPSGNPTTLQFLWTPIGCDCDDDCSPEDYTLKAVADCDNSVAESNENNNESTTVERVYWTGYMADEPLEHIIHGTIEGGLYYTTGDGLY